MSTCLSSASFATYIYQLKAILPTSANVYYCFSLMFSLKVESLFRTYHKRLAKLAKGKRQPITDGSKKSSQQTEVASTSQSSSSGSNSLPKEKDDDETCPICLLEMVEGESMTICTEGCLNKLHHHCMSICKLLFTMYYNSSLLVFKGWQNGIVP